MIVLLRDRQLSVCGETVKHITQFHHRLPAIHRTMAHLARDFLTHVDASPSRKYKNSPSQSDALDVASYLLILLGTFSFPFRPVGQGTPGRGGVHRDQGAFVLMMEHEISPHDDG